MAGYRNSPHALEHLARIWYPIGAIRVPGLAGPPADLHRSPARGFGGVWDRDAGSGNWAVAEIVIFLRESLPLESRVERCCAAIPGAAALAEAHHRATGIAGLCVWACGFGFSALENHLRSLFRGVSMSPFLQFALSLVIVITAAKLGGLLSLKLGQPSVLGELSAGLILGPSVLDFLHWAPFTDQHLGDSLAHLAELGVLLLMFIAGLDLHLTDLAKSIKVSAFSGTLGVLVPLGLGFAAARMYGFDNQTAIFTGLILAATSVSISAQTLMELRVLRSRVGIGLLGAAVFDDVLVVLGLSIFVALALGSGGGVGAVAWIAIKMALFLAIAAALGMTLIPRFSRRIDNLPISQGLIAFTFVVVIFYAWSAEVLGGWPRLRARSWPG
ncbi:MAG: cation:proton antiporter [Chloroflexi bacterium]|nr:cation:proton antiporter [Chloroflexota bacterium]